MITAEVPKEAVTVRDLQGGSEDDDVNDSDCAAAEQIDFEVTPPTTAAANEATNTLERYLISRGAEESVLYGFYGIQKFIGQQVAAKQSTITDFFRKCSCMRILKNLFMFMFALHVYNISVSIISY